MQGGSSESFSRRDRQLGLLVLSLFLRWPEWVHRRVETVSFVSPDTNRRRVTIDFSLPDYTDEGFETDGDPTVCLTPLTLLRKRPLTNFDFCDESGASLPLVTKQRNGALSAALLAGLAASSAPAKLREAAGSIPPPELDLAFRQVALADGAGPGIVKAILDGVEGDGRPLPGGRACSRTHTSCRLRGRSRSTIW